MMAPAASPPTTPAATPQPRQCACTEDGNAAASVAAAASAMIVFFMGGPLGPDCSFGPDHPPKFVTRSLRTDKPRLAPADKVAVLIAKLPAGPVATRATCRIGGAVALINHVAGSR